MEEHKSTNPLGQIDSSIVILPFSLRMGEQDINLFLNIQKIVRVVEVQEVELLPENNTGFVGIFDMDGTPFPVVDLKKAKLFSSLFGFEDENQQEGQRVIICQVLHHHIGLVVDHTRKVRKIPNVEIKPPPTVWGNHPIKFMSGMIKEQDGFRYMFDLENFMSSINIDVGHIKESGSTSQALTGRKILVVEDSKFYLAMVQKCLARQGALTRVAENGQEALDLLKTSGIIFDLIISDIEMPIMNGMDMARSYKKSVSQPTPIVFHSSLSNPTLIQDLLNEGLGEYLPKFDEATIVNRVVEILRHEK